MTIHWHLGGHCFKVLSAFKCADTAIRTSEDHHKQEKSEVPQSLGKRNTLLGFYLLLKGHAVLRVGLSAAVE